MREFSADYLRRTREGMWDDTRQALCGLSLEDRERVLDVGCGTGELSRVLVEETPAETTVIGCDVDTTLLARASESVPVVAGDARRLPFPDDSFDLIVCQALLINLPDPAAAVAEFARVSSDLVAAIEPDNSAVTIRSSVEGEPALASRARDAYLDGVDTDVALGASARDAFESADLSVCGSARYDHDRSIEPPYDAAAVRSARRKASGAGLAEDRTTLLEGELTPEGYDDLRADWREMGRTVIAQMGERDYRRTETVPFYVTVGRVDD
ncbi:class I SAM-dependent methyltransferase [Halovivax gelatinilyticus]|uniref:class I SAM-dependent methyltransferase n=1 Tax=Halovivax gelatinilyticus TaxID=2961597 RepID=UPI0020CA8257|nr:class I SAM-dependent methyltransferase [Halovivax gelatinilyticus]